MDIDSHCPDLVSGETTFQLTSHHKDHLANVRTDLNLT